MKRKQLYLHIGRAKVGSTALQHFLWTNRQLLAQQGVLYPDSVMMQSASHKLALVFQHELPDAEPVRELSAAEVYGAMFDEAERLNLRRIVASSENLFLVKPAEPARCMRRGYDVRIVCYVRRQDEVLVSSYIQELKTGDSNAQRGIEKFASDPLRLAWLDYEPVLDAWAAQFGRENIIVRVAEKEQLRGTIFEDFLDLVGVDTSGMTFPQTRLNPSPARDILDFIQMINAAPAPGPRMKFQLRDPLLALSERIGAQGRYSPRSLVPAGLRRELMERFRKSNAAVARKYLGREDGILFRDDRIEESDADTPYAGLDLERFAHMMATLLGTQQHRILNLQRQINELKHRLEQ
ncbi:MAG: hypothetical protein WC809_12475 [Sinimarinibacterium sp.]|jgi:hypothetical protein